MIESFGNLETERLFTTGKSRRLPPDILRRAVMRLAQIDAATDVNDLRLPPSNRLEALSVTAPGNGASASMTNGACACASTRATRKTSRSSITTEEPTP